VEQARFGRTKVACFLSYVEDRYKYKYSTITYTYIHSPIRGLFEETRGEGGGEENGRELMILKYIASVEEQGTRKHTAAE
jgi:hypothetical protein